MSTRFAGTTCLLGLAVVATGLTAGFFVTYQISVTRGLAQVGDAAYVETFQAINATVRTGWFAAFFFGALPLLAASAILARGSARVSLVVATLAYAAVLVITFAGNVPLNDQLAAVELSGDLAMARADFENDWNRLNLFRTLAALAAFVLAAFVSAVLPLARPRTAP